MLGRALKVIRQFHRMSQSELAKSLRVSSSYLSEMENERKEPSMDILKLYSSYFNIKLSSIMLFAERMDSPERSDQIQYIVAAKVLKMLEWIAMLDEESEYRDRRSM